MERIKPLRVEAAPFCHVERRENGKKKYFVVHAEAPRFVAEMEMDRGGDSAPRRAVIRRVCLPNSWTGDYHLNAKSLGEAAAFFESTARFREDEQQV